jgi:hypothetical protein
MRLSEFIKSIGWAAEGSAARRVCATGGDITPEAIMLLPSVEDGRSGTFLTKWH